MANVTKIRRNDLEFGDMIGEGGFSAVYKATWTVRNLDVAAKKLIKVNPRELEMLSKLEHPNIVELIGVVDEHPDYYLILELCKGGSLKSYLERLNSQGERLSLKQFLIWAKQVAAPIEYLRGKGVVHKDIKSPNYVITDLKGKVLKLCDFGLAKDVDITMSNATESASYPWMAPELQTAFVLSPSYDIYSLAVVIWELWTTQFPFKGLESQVVLMRVCGDHEHPPIPDDCPQFIADLLLRCWEVDWKKRPNIHKVLQVITRVAEANISLVCRGCNNFACYANDLTIVGSSSEDAHYTNTNTFFKQKKVDFRQHHAPEKRRRHVKKIYCKRCSQDWGNTHAEQPCLKMRGFECYTATGDRYPFRQWSQFCKRFPDFSRNLEQCIRVALSKLH